MLHTNNPIIKHKAGLLNLAEELRNVSKACKIMGVSRDTFYRYQELVETNGLEALINQDRRVPNLKNRVDEATKQVVVAYAVEYPAHGQHRTSNELRKSGIYVSGSGVRSIWLRHQLANFKDRLNALEAKISNEGIILEQSVQMLHKRGKTSLSAKKTRNQCHPEIFPYHYCKIFRVVQRPFTDDAVILSSVRTVPVWRDQVILRITIAVHRLMSICLPVPRSHRRLAGAGWFCGA